MVGQVIWSWTLKLSWAGITAVLWQLVRCLKWNFSSKQPAVAVPEGRQRPVITAQQSFIRKLQLQRCTAVPILTALGAFSFSPRRLCQDNKLYGIYTLWLLPEGAFRKDLTIQGNSWDKATGSDWNYISCKNLWLETHRPCVLPETDPSRCVFRE